MFTTPYSTTVCKDYVVEEIRTQIKKAIAHGNPKLEEIAFSPSNGNSLVLGVTREHMGVGPFTHPLDVNTNLSDRPITADNEHDLKMVVDLRNFTRIGRDGNVVITAHSDHISLMWRAYLSRIWMIDGSDGFITLGNFQITVFSRWLTEIITRRLALPPETQIRVAVLMAWHYMCMFEEDGGVDKKDHVLMGRKISEAVSVSTETVLSIIEPLSINKSASDLCQSLIEHGQSIRFEEFNLGLLYTMIGGSFFGANIREILAVAVEHPPTFIALVCMAQSDRSYRKTILGQTVINSDKRGVGDNFTKNVMRLVG